MATPAPSFERDLKPLFRDVDRDSMLSSFDLWDYDDVVTNADAILAVLDGGTMPCDGAWPPDDVDIFRRWIGSGHQP